METKKPPSFLNLLAQEGKIDAPEICRPKSGRGALVRQSMKGLHPRKVICFRSQSFIRARSCFVESTESV